MHLTNVDKKLPNFHFQMDHICPLRCKYCSQAAEACHKSTYETTTQKEEIIDVIHQMKDKYPRIQISLLGGEPLLRWKDIEDIMKMFPNEQYEFITSGYPLTKTQLQFMTNFSCTFVLSVDGSRRTTDYLRPTVTGQTYHSKFQSVVDSLLYYYPDVTAKIITPKPLIPFVFEDYLELERMGFRSIFYTPNVYENEGIKKVDDPIHERSYGTWIDKDFAAFNKQIAAINEQFCLGLTNNIQRTRVNNIDHVLRIMLFADQQPKDEINFSLFKCNFLPLKISTEPQHIHDGVDLSVTECIKNGGFTGTQKDIETQLISEFENSHTCNLDAECPYYLICKYMSCVAHNYKKTGAFLKQYEFNCNFYKPYIEQAQKTYQIMANTQNEEVLRYFGQLKRGGLYAEPSTGNILPCK